MTDVHAVHEVASGDADEVRAEPPPRLVHDVQFYESEDHLAELASSFLAAGLAEAGAVVAIVTAAHGEAIRRRLRERGFDLAAVESFGRLRILDADHTLSALLRDGMPVEESFDEIIGGELERAARLGTGETRAFGEMVDVLWRAGNPMAALRLEELWNRLRERHRFNLLCAYTMSNFPGCADAEGFADVCHAHDHAMPTERYLRIDGHDARDREVARLQQRSLALQHEIAGRREAEGRLRDAEHRMRHLVDVLPAALYTCDADGRIDFYNSRAAELWGRSPELGDPDQRFCGALRLHLPDGSPLRHEDTPMALALREGRSTRNQDVVIERPDGSRVCVLVNIDPIRDAEGRVTGAINVFHDVTEERRADEVRARLAAIVESTHDAVISLDLVGTITSWNPGAVRLYGYAPEEVISRPSSVLIPEDHADDFPLLLAALRRGDRIEHHETVRLAKDGRRIDVSLTVSPIRNAHGALVGASKIARDIGDRKRAEAALREAEEKLAAELDATTRLHGLSARLLSARELAPALEDVVESAVATCGADYGMVQLLEPDAKTLTLAAHRNLHPGFSAQFGSVAISDGITACSRAVARRERVVIEDVLLEAAFEPFRDLIAAADFRTVQSTPLVTRDGAVVGVLSTYYRAPRSVSPRDAKLLDLFARHAADLVERLRIEAALRDADRRKDEFLATLAHELRNPLAPMRNGLELLALAPHDEDVQRDTREMMRRQLDHTVRLVDDLLDLSRISRDKLQLRRGRFHLRHLVDCALETSRPLLEARRHRVCVQCPEEPIVVDADATRVTQVFANLLNNAAKFTPSGGHIDIDVRAEADHVVVAIRDYGIGIEPEMLSRVFDMFAQAAVVKEESTGGLGIGLTLAKRLVEMHGGTIQVESPGIGRGSTFTVRLPRLAGQETGAATPPRRVSSGRAPQSVLIADDNVDAAESLARLLRMSGHDVRVAHDGEQAIHAVRAFRPSVVILDVGMPRVNGCDAARRIREMSNGSCPILIAVTGWGQESDRRRTKEAGFDLHFVKPVDFHTLSEALARTLA